MVGSSLKPSRGRNNTPIHSIPNSVAHLWREIYKYYSIYNTRITRVREIFPRLDFMWFCSESSASEKPCAYPRVLPSWWDFRNGHCCNPCMGNWQTGSSSYCASCFWIGQPHSPGRRWACELSLRMSTRTQTSGERRRLDKNTGAIQSSEQIKLPSYFLWKVESVFERKLDIINT